MIYTSIRYYVLYFNSLGLTTLNKNWYKFKFSLKGNKI